MDFRGVFAPATTPFDPVTGDGDLVHLRANVRAWMRAPLAGVVLFGSTGEGPLLDEDEKARLTAGVRAVVDGGRRLAFVAGGSVRFWCGGRCGATRAPGFLSSAASARLPTFVSAAASARAPARLLLGGGEPRRVYGRLR